MTALHYRTANELAAAIRNKEIGCLELLDHFLDRIGRFNQSLNAIVWMDAERARQRARDADAALARGEVWGPLHGVPMTVKESYNLSGSPTTWGRPELADTVTETTALSLERLEKAGVVLFGKSNVPLNLADWQSFNAVYGTTNNPWDLARSPGGSSGGSAAALAAGLTGLEAGSDIGASIRNPAHYCGVYGHKPTFGIVPIRGQALPGTVAPGDISVIGPMARSADDLATALDIMAGPDLLDDVGWRLDLPRPKQRSLADFRVAVKLDDPCSEVDSEYAARLQAVADALARAGATVSDSAQPDIDMRRLHEVYVLLLRAATSGRQSLEDYAKFQAIAQDLGPEDHSYLARMARANTLPHYQWLALNNERHQMRLQWGTLSSETGMFCCVRRRLQRRFHTTRPASVTIAPYRSTGMRCRPRINCSGPV